MSPQRYDSDGVPFGHLKVENPIGPELEIYVGTAGDGTRQLIILGSPWSEEESGPDEDKWHDCDAGGCGRPGSHVLARVDLDQLNKLPTLEIQGGPIDLSPTEQWFADERDRLLYGYLPEESDE